jgi:hypothetical protein
MEPSFALVGTVDILRSEATPIPIRALAAQIPQMFHETTSAIGTSPNEGYGSLHDTNCLSPRIAQ